MEHDAIAAETQSRRRRRVFQPSGRGDRKNRRLLLQDSDSEIDPDDLIEPPNGRGHLSQSGDCAPTFEEIMSRLEIDQDQQRQQPLYLPSSPRSSLRCPTDSDRTLSSSKPRHARHSREVSAARAGMRPLPSLPLDQLHDNGNDLVYHRHYSASVPSSTDTTYTHMSSSANVGHTYSSVQSSDGNEKDTLESCKLLKRRRQILQELVLTEVSFAEDLSVVVQEYQEKTDTCPKLLPEDCTLIFGDIGPVLAFSRDLGVDLQLATSAILFSDATSTRELRRLDEQTRVGAVFGQYMSRLEKVFARYCSTQERAAARLRKISQDKAIQSWLADRHPDGRTTAWDLSSLLIKPVQRVLKYPLLLASLLDATPKHHPEFFAIELALKEMLYTAEHINKIKKRSDFVGAISTGDRKRRGTLAKTFSKGAARLRINIGLDEASDDSTYDICDGLIASFKAQQAIIQTLRSDIQEWLLAIQSTLEYHAKLSSALQDVADCGDAAPSSILPVVDWVNYSRAVADLQQAEFVEVTHSLERDVFKPLATLEAAFSVPALVLHRRDRIADDVQRERITRGAKESLAGKSVPGLVDELDQLNYTFKEELPIFLQTTEKAMQYIVVGLVKVQKNWLRAWGTRLTPLLSAHGNAGDIEQHFCHRYAIVMAHMADISLTNGGLSSAFQQVNGISRTSEESSSTSDAASLIYSNGTRPSIRARAVSAATNASFSLKQFTTPNRLSSDTTTSMTLRSRSSLQTFESK